MDYSEDALSLASEASSHEQAKSHLPDIQFEVHLSQYINLPPYHQRSKAVDLCADEPSSLIADRFDIVVDKGTWDAISLSVGGSEENRRRLDNYRRLLLAAFENASSSDKAAENVDYRDLQQYFVIVSCNFTKLNQMIISAC